MDLLSSHPLDRSLDSPSDKGATLEGVCKILAMEDLEFPILLNKSVGDDGIIVERDPKGGVEHECGLRRGYAL